MLKKNSKLAAVLTLSLVLGTCGVAGAAGADATTTVITGGGTYNSIEVDNSTQATRYDYGGKYYLCGVYDATNQNYAITMDGEKAINVTDTGKTDAGNDKKAQTIGVGGFTVKGDGVKLTVKGTGGTTEGLYADASANVAGVAYYGIAENNAVIKVEATGGKATGGNASAAYVNASAGVTATGVYYVSTVGNGAEITVQATGGTVIGGADSENGNTADATAYAYGVNDACNVGDDAVINATATGTSATYTAASGTAVASSDAYGVNERSIIGDNAVINSTATSGTSKASNGAISVSTAYGVRKTSTVGEKGVLTVMAIGKNATSTVTGATANAEAIAYGVNENSAMGGNASITVTATAGTATGEVNSQGYATAKAYGVNQNSTVGKNASINVTAISGKVTTGENSNDDTSAKAYGVCDNNTVGDNAVITVTATAGTITSGSNSRGYATAEAYGVCGNNTVGDNATIIVTTTGGTVTDGLDMVANVYSYGVYADGATNTMEGAVKIETGASVKTNGAKFNARSLAAEGSTSQQGINNLVAVGKTKTLEGDVVADSDGINNLIMDTKDSYLQGNIESYSSAGPMGTNNVTISNGATWRPVYDNRYGTDCNPNWSIIDTTSNVATNKVSQRETTYDTSTSAGTTINLSDGGIIDLTWDGWANGVYNTTRSYRSSDNNSFRKLTVANMTGAEGIIKIDSDLANNRADTLTIGGASTATSLKVQVNYDNFYANSQLGKSVTGKALVVIDNSSGQTLKVSGTQSEYNEINYAVTVEQDVTNTNQWYLVKIEDVAGTNQSPTTIPTQKTENTKHAADARDNVNNIWLIENNSLVKRLGDLRSMSTGADKDNNIWAKYGHGTQRMGTGRNTEIQYNQFQVGYDKAFEKKHGKIYRGLMVSRINGDASYERGSGDTNSTTLGLYQTWLGDKGHYYDVVLRYGKISTDYNVTDLSDNYSDADYDMWATTLSGEYGYRKNLNNGAYIEPSAELILGHIGSANYTTSKDMNVYLDATKHAITRLGLLAGKDFTKGNIYLKGNYYHDFAGGGGVTTGTVSYEKDHAKNWWEFVFGGNLQLSKNVSAYTEIRKLYGNVNSNVNYSIGARWSF